MKYILCIVVGVVLTLCVLDYRETKQELNDAVWHARRVAERCSEALFDGDEDWNEYSLSICEDVRVLRNGLDMLYKYNGLEELVPSDER